MTAEAAAQRPFLTLFVNGASASSADAVRRLHDLFEKYYPDGYDLEIVDVHQQPALVASRQVVAVPTLIRDLPAPVRLLVGNFMDQDRVLEALDLTRPNGPALPKGG
ncbi:MAG TPA: circadian clock KaiB family protein [Dermatophilaceae bacterium]|jgi:circadian clock protein KaiB